MLVSLRIYCTDSTMVPESNVPNAYDCYQMSSQGKTLTTVKQNATWRWHEPTCFFLNSIYLYWLSLFLWQSFRLLPIILFEIWIIFLVWFLVQYRQTESDAYEPTVHGHRWAQKMLWFYYLCSTSLKLTFSVKLVSSGVLSTFIQVETNPGNHHFRIQILTQIPGMEQQT